MQIQQFQKRFKKIPKIIELDHLTVTGDVYFGRNVTLRGTVIVVANEGQRIDIPDGCVLENRLVSGNLNLIVSYTLFLIIKQPAHKLQCRNYNRPNIYPSLFRGLFSCNRVVLRLVGLPQRFDLEGLDVLCL